MKVLNNRLATMILKETVVGECAYWVKVSEPDLHMNFCTIAIWAIDQPDEWWMDGRNLTVAQWIDRLTLEWTKANAPGNQ